MIRQVAAAVALAGLLACSDSAVSPLTPVIGSASQSLSQGSVVICHQPDQGATLLTVSSSALDAHLGHGDYIARLEVDPATVASDGVHYPRITDAILAARTTRIARGELTAAACRITVAVVAGSFKGSFDPGVAAGLERLPLIIDVPDITLRGALEMQIDGDGRATGASNVATTLLPDRPLNFAPVSENFIILAGHPGGPQGNGAVIQGFAFQSGRNDATFGGTGILTLRVSGFLIRGNRFESGLTTALDVRASSGDMQINHAANMGNNCGFCLAGPGIFTATGNRVTDGGLGGIFVTPVFQQTAFSVGASPVAAIEPYVLPASAAVTATLTNNDIERLQRQPAGFGIRIGAVGSGASNLPQSTTVTLNNNVLKANTFGLIVDAAFPAANTLRKGDVDVTLHGNAIAGSCQNNLLVALTRHTGALGLTSNPFLVNSTYTIRLNGDLAWADAWFSHPAMQGNTLVVDGVTIANGAFAPYNVNNVCT